MFNLKVATQFIKRSVFRNLIILFIITLGVGVQFFVLSLGEILTNMMLEQTTFYQEHIILETNESLNYNDLDYSLLDRFNNIKEVEKGIITVDLYGFLTSDKMNKPNVAFHIIGVSSHNDTYQSFYGLDLEDHIVSGRLNDSTKMEVMLDDYFAKQSNIKLGDTVTFNNNLDFIVTGTFDLGLYKASRAYAYIPMDLLNITIPNQYKYVFQIKDPTKTSKIIKQINEIDNTFTVKDWKDVTPEFNTLNMAQKSVVLIIEVMISIGIFVIVLSILNFTIQQKYKQLGILKAMGIYNNDINQIFIFQTSILAIIGTTLGLIGGSIAMTLYAKFMSYPNGQPRFKYDLLWHNFLYSIILMGATIILSTLVSIKKVKELSIIELIKI